MGAEWMKKRSHIYAIGFYSVVKKNQVKTYRKIGEIWHHCVKWNKPDSKRQMLHVFSHMHVLAFNLDVYAMNQLPMVLCDTVTGPRVNQWANLKLRLIKFHHYSHLWRCLYLKTIGNATHPYTGCCLSLVSCHFHIFACHIQLSCLPQLLPISLSPRIYSRINPVPFTCSLSLSSGTYRSLGGF